MKKSHHEILVWIEKAFGVSLTSDKTLLAEFVEVCQRRHILMHADGIVSRRYLKNCESAGFPIEKLQKMGERVQIDRKYLRRATSRVFQFDFFTLHILWQKVIPKHAKSSLQCCLETSHDFLDLDLTKMARRVCDFSLNTKAKLTDKHSAFFVINRAQSFLFDPTLSDDERGAGLEATLSQRDWSMVNPTVQLALACLKRDYTNLGALTSAAVLGGLDYYAAQTWSIFREVRDKEDFRKHFEPGTCIPRLESP